MSGGPAYIGKPPPQWTRKRREWEQQRAREREVAEQERELSPAVPDPPVTPSRSAIFGSPNKSARVYKTYAHKRARSQASSVAGEPDDAQDDASRESSPEPSPTKDTHIPAYTEPEPSSTRAKRAHSRSTRQVATSSTAAGPSSNRRPYPSSPSVFVEIPSRRHPLPAQSNATAPTASVERTRGRSRETKGIALPSPSSTSEENGDSRPRKRARVPSGPGMSLSEALNHSFARTNSAHPSPISATPASFASVSLPAASSSALPNANALLKRKPGRPRGRGRGRGLAPVDHVVPHSVVASAASQVASSSARAPTSAAGSGVASSSRAQPIMAEEEEESADEDVAPVVPAKRPRGRPRKNSAPQPPSRTSSRPRRSVSRRRSSQQPQLSSDSETVAAQLMQDFDSPSQINLQQSVDVLPVARALEEQAMWEADQSSASAKRPRGRPKGSKNKATLEREASAVDVRHVETALEDHEMHEAGPSPPPRPRGRPKGSKNRSTLEREALARAAADQSLPAIPIVPAPAPVKRGPGRPRKSAPNPPTLPLAETVDYMEPLKDPDAEDVPHPSTLHPGRRGRSRTRRNSTPAAPSESHAYYLDMTTLQWKPRARSVSASPSKRLMKAVKGGNEYQTSGRLCAALKQKLLQAPHPKTKETSTPDKDDALRVSRSGVLLLGDQGAEEAAPTEVFSGCWEVLADKDAVCDDALALKTLHDVVKRLGICISFGEDGPILARSDDGRTVAVAVPCGCLSLQERSSSSGGTKSSSPLECAGEMTVSVTEQEEESFPGAKVHRVTVSVMH
ncbi:hypothetical protein OH76DRAFT_436154 [Lentinus brumalis]|uniref:Uncharacterized protein n=1 Tax=Lentinus brumalis TaxID=2498619 RepID=A0A371DDR9_9APHY|nr:hypothetical protein OH76DRAFT_436154 [Polyporus brumalis]